MDIGGHRVTRMADRGAEAQYECADCLTRGTSLVFRVGVDGCAKRPESLNLLTVCAGGDRCPTHMDMGTVEWRQWKDSPSLPASHVPHYTCEAGARGERARRHFLDYSKRIGLAVENWRETAFDETGDGSQVATFVFSGGRYELWVSRTTGQLTPLRVGAA